MEENRKELEETTELDITKVIVDEHEKATVGPEANRVDMEEMRNDHSTVHTEKQDAMPGEKPPKAVDREDKEVDR